MESEEAAAVESEAAAAVESEAAAEASPAVVAAGKALAPTVPAAHLLDGTCFRLDRCGLVVALAACAVPEPVGRWLGLGSGLRLGLGLADLNTHPHPHPHPHLWGHEQPSTEVRRHGRVVSILASALLEG